MKHLTGALLCVLAFASCDKEDTLTPIPPVIKLPAEAFLNVSYGSDPAQRLDVYLPYNRNTSTTKTLFLIHGGAWSSGDKSDMKPFVDSVQRRLPDYAVINVNYRLANSAGQNLFPSQEMDIKAAVEFVNARRAEYNISPKFAIGGVSAGAHLAALQAYKYTAPVKMKAVADFFGPTDMTAMYNDPAPASPPGGIAFLLSGTPASNPVLYQYSSPLLFVTGTTTPTIIFHGGADNIVKVSQSTALRDKLVLNGVRNEYVFYPSEGHGWGGANLVHSFDRMERFLNMNVQ